jgi:hypothetical protein
MPGSYLDLGLGIAPSGANLSQSGGPFVNNSEIVFGNGIFGAQYQDQQATANPTAAASGKGEAVANPYAPNGSLVSSLGGSSPYLIYGAIAIAGGLALWYILRKKKT